MAKKDKINYICLVGMMNENNEILYQTECEGEKKVIIDFINKYNQKYSVLYFHEKNLKFVVKINELDWMTVEDLINKNLAVRRLK